MFASYVSALLNIHYGLGMLATIVLSWLSSIVFTVLILYLSSRLSRVYFIVGTLALYMFVLQLATNREAVTNGTFGLSGIGRNLIGNITVPTLGSYLIVCLIIGALVVVGLTLFKRTYLFTILK